jgi:ubiquinone/menaquinone biosynthesis C-methylase UbiE
MPRSVAPASAEEMTRAMRAALDPGALRSVYDRAAGYYNRWHALATARADQRGRAMLVRRCVRRGDRVLDAGGGTGLTSKIAAAAAGPEGSVVLLDFSSGMLRRAVETGATGPSGAHVRPVMGDISRLPFPPGSFDVVLSTYSVCPLEDPVAGVAAMYRMVKPGGMLGVAHSWEPASGLTHWIGKKVEDLVWRWPQLSLGCRAVSVLPELRRLGARVVVDTRIGVPLWPFRVFVVEKPAG